MRKSIQARIPRLAGRLTLAVAAAALLMTTAGCTKLRARDQLNKGVQAYKASKFETAEEHFKNAMTLDPNLTVAKLYLATACVSQYVPGGESEENVRKANCALEQYKNVLDAQEGSLGSRILSVKGMASLYFNMKKFDEAKDLHKQAISMDADDQTSYYSVAVIDWTQSYVPRQEERGKLGLSLSDPIKDKKVCEDLRTKNWDRVDEGIKMLEKALSIQKDYDDAMAYLNLLYRERADIQCGNDEARKADLTTADEWVEKTMATKKAKAEKAGEQHGIVLDEPAK